MVIIEEEEAVVEVETEYFAWPRLIVLGWIAGVFIFNIIILGIYAQFIAVQKDLHRPVPWYFSMSLAVAIITIIFLVVMVILFQIRLLTPFYMFAFATVGFILTLVALIGTSLGLFANQNNAANDYCHAYGINWSGTRTATVVAQAGAQQAGSTVTTTSATGSSQAGGSWNGSGSGPAVTSGATTVVTTAVGAVGATAGNVLVYIGEHRLSQFFWRQLCACWKTAFVFQLFTCLAFLFMIYLAFDVLTRNRGAAVAVVEEEEEIA